MNEPGWYHAAGDPAGTQRYWDGRTWQGQPTTNPGLGEVFYTAPVDVIPNDAYGVTTATGPVRAKYSNPPRIISRRPRFPKNVRGGAMILSILKAIPLAAAAWIANVLYTRPDSLDAAEIGERFDLGYSLGPTSSLRETLLLIVGIGGILLLTQFYAAIASRPWLLFWAAALLTVVDIFNVITTFSATASPLFALVALIWQARIAVGAYDAATRR